MPAQRATRKRTPAPMGNTAVRLGKRLRELRENRGLSQSELGSPYFTRSHVSAIEQGRTAPAIKTLVHFARKLRLRSVRDLLPPDL
jgi:transcriptional regulator with XRE-family HTH domain